MRHRVAGRKLSRTSSHRKALRKSLCQALFQFERIKTTKAKAKEVQPMAEKLITMAKKGDLHARRIVIAELGDRSLFVGDPNDSKNEKKRKEFKDTVVRKLFRDLAPRFEGRNGGYTRIVKLSQTRVGDGSQLVILELVSDDDEERKAPKGRRRKASSSKTKETKATEEKVIEDDESIETEPEDATEAADEQADATEAEAEEPEPA
ncbi:MAG: 50S ribosomal protein L17, partial [Hyphomicrobiaceae bacterium]|nr:50S ribosomal protein L17 [Hyphomicrobiaceae bacterium]